MTRLPFLLLLPFLAAFAVAAESSARLEFIRVWPAWRDAAAFDRITEYFGRPEPQGRERILRTQPDERAGYYFLVRVRAAGSVPEGAGFELEVIRPDSPLPRTFRFPADFPRRENVFQLGLTGEDWPGGERTHPVAWRLRVVDPSGSVLAEEMSFLWAKPAK